MLICFPTLFAHWVGRILTSTTEPGFVFGLSHDHVHCGAFNGLLLVIPALDDERPEEDAEKEQGKEEDDSHGTPQQAPGRGVAAVRSIAVVGVVAEETDDEYCERVGSGQCSSRQQQTCRKTYRTLKRFPR